MSRDATARFNVHDAKTNLSRILERVQRGEEIIVAGQALRSRRSCH